MPSLIKMKRFIKKHPLTLSNLIAYHVSVCYRFAYLVLSVLPLDGLLLFLHHMCQLLEYGAQLHNSALNVLHGVCTALDVGIL